MNHGFQPRFSGGLEIKLNSIHVNVVAADEIRRLPDTWTVADYRRLLDLLDIDDAETYSDADVEEMALMALQDRDAEESMQIVLTHYTDGLFSLGQIKNLCEELKEESAWEEYPEIDHQRALYVCVDLLNMAFPGDYPEPSAAAVHLTLAGPGLGRAHAVHPLEPETLLRIVGRIQDEGSILNRFFSRQIAGAAFPEAQSVIWRLDPTVTRADEIAVTFYGTTYWFRDIQEGNEQTIDIDWPER